jgi:hypothetical protein
MSFLSIIIMITKGLGSQRPVETILKASRDLGLSKDIVARVAAQLVALQRRDMSKGW